MESRPLYDEVIMVRTVNGVPYRNRAIRCNPTLLAMTLESLEHPEEWSIADFGDCYFLTGPPFGAAVDLSWDRDVQRGLHGSPTKDGT